MGNSFQTGKKRNNIGIVEETSYLFIDGLTRYKSKAPISVPITLIVFWGTMMFCSMLAEGIANYQITDWLQLCINMIFITVSLICGSMIIRYRGQFIKLSKEIDSWWTYNYLDVETDCFKKHTKSWIEWYGSYYYSGMYFALAMNLVPLLKCYILGKSANPINNLLYPCWTPLNLETWWGFILTYLFQFCGMYLSYFSFGNTCFYLTTAYVSLGYQARLVGLAILSVEERCHKILKDVGIPTEDRKKYFELCLNKEIISCIKHYQKLQRCAKELRDIYAIIANLAYGGGMMVVSLSGIRIATETDKLMLVNSFMNTGVTLGNQFVVSLICELLTGEVEKLRNIIYDSNWTDMPVSSQKYIYTFQMMMYNMPTLVTITGVKTNFENFSKVVNASYCYFSLILSMRKESSYSW